MTKPIKAYAAKQAGVLRYFISYHSNAVKREIGEAFNENWREGWKEARENGYRVVPVEIREIER